MFKLKSYVRKRTRPKGSIAKGYLTEECMTLVSKYLNRVETSLTLLGQNQEDDGSEVDKRIDMFNNIGLALGSKLEVAFNPTELEDMHRYVLVNWV